MVHTGARRLMPILLLLLLVCRMVGQTVPTRNAGILQPDHPIERELGTGQSDEYTLQVPAGRFVRMVARQMGVDVVVTIVDPQGKTLVEADRPNGMFGPEAVSFIADASGEYHVRVSPNPGASGRYRMESLESHEPTAADRSRIEAERALFQAARDSDPATRETRLRSIALYERARTLWHALGDAYEEGLSLYGIAGRYDELEDQQKELEYYDLALPLRRAAGDSPGEADTLASIGSIYEVRGENQKALDFDGQVVRIRHALSDPLGEGTALHNVARVYATLGDNQKALDTYSQALVIRRSSGDRGGEWRTLSNVAALHDKLGDHQKALDVYGQALAVCRVAGDRPSEASTLNAMANVHFALNEKQKAVEIL